MLTAFSCRNWKKLIDPWMLRENALHNSPGKPTRYLALQLASRSQIPTSSLN
jgi:hypothetical protein